MEQSQSFEACQIFFTLYDPFDTKRAEIFTGAIVVKKGTPIEWFVRSSGDINTVFRTDSRRVSGLYLLSGIEHIIRREVNRLDVPGIPKIYNAEDKSYDLFWLFTEGYFVVNQVLFWPIGKMEYKIDSGTITDANGVTVPNIEYRPADYSRVFTSKADQIKDPVSFDQRVRNSYYNFIETIIKGIDIDQYSLTKNIVSPKLGVGYFSIMFKLNDVNVTLMTTNQAAGSLTRLSNSINGWFALKSKEDIVIMERIFIDYFRGLISSKYSGKTTGNKTNPMMAITAATTQAWQSFDWHHFSKVTELLPKPIDAAAANLHMFVIHESRIMFHHLIKDSELIKADMEIKTYTDCNTFGFNGYSRVLVEKILGWTVGDKINISNPEYRREIIQLITICRTELNRQLDCLQRIVLSQL